MKMSMNTKLTLEDLERLRKEYEAATPGKWIHGTGFEQSIPGNYIAVENGKIIAAEQDETDCILRKEDAIHIIGLHNAFPSLLDLAGQTLAMYDTFKKVNSSKYCLLDFDDDIDDN